MGLVPLAAPFAARAQETATVPVAPTRLEFYAGYAYFRPLGGTIATRPYQPIVAGAAGSATLYFNRFLGAQLEAGASPDGPNDRIFTGEGGPVFRYPIGRLTPFVHALGGAANVTGPAEQPRTWGWGLTGGGGIDYVVPGFNHQLAVRPIQADYQFSHVDFGKIALPGGLTGGLSEIRAYRLSAGVVLRFGGNLQQERALMYGCTASPANIFAGDPVSVSGSAIGPATRNRSVYTWTTSGGQIVSDNAVPGDTISITTTGLSPGDYTVAGHLAQGKHASQNASCTASFRVQAPLPPIVSCSANPVSIMAGGRATITATASSPQNRPLSFSYTASAGQIASSLSIATLDTAGAPAGPISVSCRVSDDLGQSADASTIVNVSLPPPPVAERRSLCSITFTRDPRRPVRVDNEAKACLDDVALTLNREASARLAITGENSADETVARARARAANARLYLTQEKGIDPARIDIGTGKLGTRSAEIELIPIGTPIHYSDLPAAPAASGGRMVDIPAAAPELPGKTATEDYGSASRQRSPDSLVLPALPGDRATTSASGRRAAARRRRRRSRRTPGAADTSGTAGIPSTPTQPAP